MKSIKWCVLSILLAGILGVLIPQPAVAQTTIRFAVIGDYGHFGPNELSVSNLVKSWSPDFIITTGDNNYPNGEASTIDDNIGQYYHEFIGNYKGNYGGIQLVTRGDSARALVPTDDSLGMAWITTGFDDSDWLGGTTGIGYEVGVGYEDYIGLDVREYMHGVSTSVYLRNSFTIENINSLQFHSVILRIQYDDGFVAYLNGAKVAYRNAPQELGWNSSATTIHDDTDAINFESINITNHVDLLVTGPNVLAIHGLNFNLASSDMLITPELVMTSVDTSGSRFFPSMGNHDWVTSNAQPYLDYFTLPGTERYYDFIWGPVHFFAIDSDVNEPDGISSTSNQAIWLQSGLGTSTAPWKIVYLHHAPFSSGFHGPNSSLQWPYQEWGATVVLAGHDHVYERIIKDSFTYFVNGLGGRSIHPFVTDDPDSKLQYNGDFGAMLIEANNVSIKFKFYSVNPNHGYYGLVDSYTIPQPVPAFRVERSTGNVFAQGPFIPGGADIAERINVSEQVEPGDVVELDPTWPGHYRKARRFPGQLIAGVITTNPGFTLGNSPEEMESPIVNTPERGLKVRGVGRPMLVLMGRTPVKVTTENGPIHPGDLLTVSSKKAGYAMRCRQAKDCKETIVGKVLGVLETEEGMIPVLLMSH